MSAEGTDRKNGDILGMEPGIVPPEAEEEDIALLPDSSTSCYLRRTAVHVKPAPHSTRRGLLGGRDHCYKSGTGF